MLLNCFPFWWISHSRLSLVWNIRVNISIQWNWGTFILLNCETIYYSFVFHIIFYFCMVFAVCKWISSYSFCATFYFIVIVIMSSQLNTEWYCKYLCYCFFSSSNLCHVVYTQVYSLNWSPFKCILIFMLHSCLFEYFIVFLQLNHHNIFISL